MDDSGTEAWTQVNLQQLLATMKATLPGHARNLSYITAQKTVDWNKVAFPPFSPEACQEKWKQILRKMSKTRTLIELIDEANGVITNPVKNVKIHPECPKRPAPPTAIFFEENVSDYQKTHPNRSRQNIFRKLCKKYKLLPCEEKAPYEDKFQLANEEYMRKMELFSKQYLKGDFRKSTLKKLSAKNKAVTRAQVSKDTEGMPPKPSINGYTLFCKEQSASGTAYKGVNVWAQSWRDMTEKRKDVYNTSCKRLKSQYVVELKEYLMNFDEAKQQRILKETGIKRPKELRDIKRRDKNKIPGEPKITFRSGCDIFRKKQMFLLKDHILNSKERFGRVNKMWLDLSSEEKKRYQEEVFKDNKKYCMELQKWFETLSAAEQQLYRMHNPSKLRYLDAVQMEVYNSEKTRAPIYRPSDSEDEDTEESEDEVESDEEEEEEEDDDVIVFEVY
ncbi:nucleolar transcription factor 1-B-like isoform X1 [Pseudoliparis swirei]|uniref:nucleolar transcription factor 1-B-like isoform X1 n=1 Tax=Pseudoliparis swirei TaxID=2059687 RepID=UPI0024BDFBF5|nr:nucleolar transcription factor 1-B-like isoform X1 [Pseudoliparis swirei]